MHYKKLGTSDLNVPVLCFGTATFGGVGAFFQAWGVTDVTEARRLIDICLDAGLNFFDTADVYSNGAAEEILGEALGAKRANAIVATKFGYGGDASAAHIVSACEGSLRRLKTDYIDLLQLHGFDERTPVEETLRALEDLIKAGKVRHIGGSNFSGWHLAKFTAAADHLKLHRPVSHQVYYSLLCRDFEHEMMPAGYDQTVSTIVWSPLSGGKLTGKIRRGQTLNADSRTAKLGGLGDGDAKLYDIVDAMAEIAAERGKSISQVALNWLLRRPTVASLVIGARNEAQLRDNLGAAEWRLSDEDVARLDAVSATPAPYPYAHQAMFPHLLRALPPSD